MKNKYLLIFIVALSMFSCINSANNFKGQTYYIDGTGGNDANSGLSEKNAWKTLDKVENIVLEQGDKVLLKRGTTYKGEFEISAQGSSTERIIIGSYGEGAKPLIIGNDTSMYAVRILNSDYVTLRDIEITNEGKERLARRTGLKIECTNYGVSNNIIVDSVDIRDVNGLLVKTKGAGSGILIVNGGDEIISTFDSLMVQNCTIRRTERNAMIWSGYYLRQNWHPSTNTIIRNNLIEEVPGDGIVPIGCDGVVIEYNLMRNCPATLPLGEAAAGIWPWSCDNVLIQYNEVSDHKAPWDAQGFDSDYNCTNTTIQYNYSHDNEGGFVLICNEGRSMSTFSVGNKNTIVRYNLSIGDGVRSRKTRRAGYFSPSIHLAGPIQNTMINNNIIHALTKPNSDIDCSFITSDNWDGYSDSTTIRNNVFYTPEKSTFRLTKSTNNKFDNNYYLGKFEFIPEDINAKRESNEYQRIINQATTDASALVLQLTKKTNAGNAEMRYVDKESIHEFFKQINE